jgi:formate-dependent nitrite reductase membrane component NrfD
LPYYLHDYKAYGRITIMGEFLAIASIVMCLLFILVDLGQPMRALNVLLYPTPNSVLFYDAIVLNGYLFLNRGGLERWKPNVTAPTTRNGSSLLFIYRFPGP